jgi:hypothetical protein
MAGRTIVPNNGDLFAGAPCPGQQVLRPPLQSISLEDRGKHKSIKHGLLQVDHDDRDGVWVCNTMGHGMRLDRLYQIFNTHFCV